MLPRTIFRSLKGSLGGFHGSFILITFPILSNPCCFRIFASRQPFSFRICLALPTFFHCESFLSPLNGALEARSRESLLGLWFGKTVHQQQPSLQSAIQPHPDLEYLCSSCFRTGASDSCFSKNGTVVIAIACCSALTLFKAVVHEKCILSTIVESSHTSHCSTSNLCYRTQTNSCAAQLHQ